jgi:hypothetical protein
MAPLRVVVWEPVVVELMAPLRLAVLPTVPSLALMGPLRVVVGLAPVLVVPAQVMAVTKGVK